MILITYWYKTNTWIKKGIIRKEKNEETKERLTNVEVPEGFDWEEQR